MINALRLLIAVALLRARLLLLFFTPRVLFRLTGVTAIAVMLSIWAMPVENAEADSGPNYVKVVKLATDFTAAATSKVLTLYVVPQDMLIWKVVLIRDVDFAENIDAGHALSAATIEVGKSGNTTKYLTATDVFTGVTNGVGNGYIGDNPGLEVAGTAITATLRTTGANTSVLADGRLTFKIYMSAAGP